jgi:integrase
MSALAQSLADYLAVRRALGYKLVRPGKLLAQFLEFLEDAGAPMITTDLALRWATLPAGAGGCWWSYRLGAVRGFAAHLHTIDPACEVPPADLLAYRPSRRTPYIYTEPQILALMAASEMLRTEHRAMTYRTLIGLLSVTGMRIGEAIRLDRGDIDTEHALLIVHDSKFGKSRQLPLHPSTTDALSRYLRRGDRPTPAAPTAAVFVSSAGTRLLYCAVQHTFAGLLDCAGMPPRSAACRPRLHDIRHTFAVRSVLDAYRSNADVNARLPLLSTYLGHVNPGCTYWYLQAAPELLGLAGERLEQHLQGGAR